MRAPFADADLKLLEDLTDRAALVVGQWQVLADLRAAVAARDEFVSIASHELRTPLTALDLQLEGIQRAYKRDPTTGGGEKTQRRLEIASKQVDRLTVLIEGLLDVSRIETGRLRLELSEFDLTEMIREVVERFDEATQRAACSIRIQLPPSAVGYWDSTRMDQVLTNMMSNALKYGAGKPIDVSTTVSADHVTLSVRDHGIGIAQEDLHRIFRRFERAVPSNHYGGLGLGLYIARQIVQAHGGSIDVASRPGEETIFTVDLPKLTAKEPGAGRRINESSYPTAGRPRE